jgi:hypothetical protein
MDDAPKKAPVGWLEALEEGMADLAAGRTVPLEKVLQEFDEDFRKFELARKQTQIRPRVAHRR